MTFGSSTQMQLNIRVAFNSQSTAMAAQLNIYRGVQDSRGQNSGWAWDSAGVWWQPTFSVLSLQPRYMADPPGSPASIPCKLQVVGPPSYSITRANGNRIRLTSVLTLAAPVTSPEVWAAKVQIVVYFRPTGGSKTDISLIAGIPENTSTITSATPVGTIFGVTNTSQSDNSVTLDPRGSGEYSVSMRTSASLTAGASGCNGSTSNLTLVAASSQLPVQLGESAAFTVQRPSVTTNGITGMWWLGGEKDVAAGLYDEVQLVGERNCSSCSSSLQWTVTTGSDKANLTCSLCNSTTAKALKASSGCNAQDVTVVASLDGFKAADTKLSINSFVNVRRVTQRPPPTTEYLGGWRTPILYQMDHLCGPANFPVSLNESIGPKVPSLASEWPLPALRAGFVVPFGDEIAVWPTQPGSVQPVPPMSVLGLELGDQIPWTIRAGSLVTALGLLLITTDQLRYLDHGDHSSNPAVPPNP